MAVMCGNDRKGRLFYVFLCIEIYIFQCIQLPPPPTQHLHPTINRSISLFSSFVGAVVVITMIQLWLFYIPICTNCTDSSKSSSLFLQYYRIAKTVEKNYFALCLFFFFRRVVHEMTVSTRLYCDTSSHLTTQFAQQLDNMVNRMLNGKAWV